MASALSPAPGPVLFSRRVIEWGLLLAVVVVALVVLWWQQRALQRQAEVAMVRSTLGYLRSALVVDHLRAQVAGQARAVAPAQRNPFALLERPPPNYRGERPAHDPAATDPGSWVFDSGCGCAAYAPLDPQSLPASQGTGELRFRVSGPPGPPQLLPLQRSVLNGELLE